METVSVDVADRVATVRLNRPGARNGFTPTMADELCVALERLDGDAGVRVVVLTGAGADFCVGADLSGSGLTAAALAPGPDGYAEPAGRVSTRLIRMDKPVIAALNGAAAGAGFTIPLAADFRLAATNTVLTTAFTRRGIVAEGCSHWLLPRIVGHARALDWILTARRIGPDEALAAGLVARVVPPGQLLPAAYELASVLVEHTAPVAVAVSRRLLYEQWSMTLDEVHALESRLVLHLLGSADAVEGVTSFLQRRAPVFPGTVPDDVPPFVPWTP